MEVVAAYEPDPTIEGPCPPAPMLWHELANLFPMLEGQAFADLVEDVRANGVREPIVMFEGRVLDGRNRYMAAREAGLPYPVVEYTGDDALSYVVSLNLKRRHLDEGQRATVGAKIANLKHGGSRRHDQPANLPLEGSQPAPITQATAARMMNVSERSVRTAGVVLQHGTPALVAQVETGQVSVSAAAEVARLPEVAQIATVEAGPDAVRDLAANLRAASPDEKAALREQVIDMAERGLKPAPRADRRNPDYRPDPAFQAMASVAGAAQSIAQKIEEIGVEAIAASFHDDAMRLRNRATFILARDSLTKLIEACHAE